MRPHYWLSLFLILLLSCIEPYEFVIKNESPGLVVEGFISNVSYNETLKYPSDGRFFTISLRRTSDVINVSDEVVEHASVTLVSDSGEEWEYSESSSKPGTYLLDNKAFKAIPTKKYKLGIVLSNGISYESDWEEMPSVNLNPMGAIGFEEVNKQISTVQLGKEVIKTIKGVDVNINLPENRSGKTVFYRWEFTPTWIYSAPLARPSEPIYKCWATNKNYLSNYTLQSDLVGGYKKNLFFMSTVRNERIFESLSVLIKQYELTTNFYNFWKEMQEQTEAGGLSDIPPYNLQTNIKRVDGTEEKVSGYFGVVSEKATRWYFNKGELSYYVHNVLKADCEVSYGGPPHPECFNCLEYSRGTASNIEPSWWE